MPFLPYMTSGFRLRHSLSSVRRMMSACPTVWIDVVVYDSRTLSCGRKVGVCDICVRCFGNYVSVRIVNIGHCRFFGVVIFRLIFIPTTASGSPPLDLKSRGGLGRYRLQHTFASTLGEVDSAQPKTEGFIQISAKLSFIPSDCFAQSPPLATRGGRIKFSFY